MYIIFKRIVYYFSYRYTCMLLSLLAIALIIDNSCRLQLYCECVLPFCFYNMAWSWSLREDHQVVITDQSCVIYDWWDAVEFSAQY